MRSAARDLSTRAAVNGVSAAATTMTPSPSPTTRSPGFINTPPQCTGTFTPPAPPIHRIVKTPWDSPSSKGRKPHLPQFVEISCPAIDDDSGTTAGHQSPRRSSAEAGIRQISSCGDDKYITRLTEVNSHLTNGSIRSEGGDRIPEKSRSGIDPLNVWVQDALPGGEIRKSGRLYPLQLTEEIARGPDNFLNDHATSGGRGILATPPTPGRQSFLCRHVAPPVHSCRTAQ
jgi:hypothetical protein